MENKLESFSINGLFGTMNVNLNFNEIENIYIGENGIGKTTILTTIFYTLKRKFLELSKIEFHSIQLKFIDELPYYFTKEEIEQYLELNNRRMGNVHRILAKEIEADYSNEISELLNIKENSSGRKMVENEIFLKVVSELSDKTRIPLQIIRREVIEYVHKIELSSKSFNDLVERLIKFDDEVEILYFPTFRRIEEDLNKLLAFSEEDDDDFEYRKKVNEKGLNKYGELIKFGMVDVENSINELLEKIRKTSINSFNQMTAILLKQYVDKNLYDEEIDIIDSKSLNISLNRVGNEIEKDYKNRIINLVETNEIYNEENSYLLNFILNLLNSHEQLKNIDKKIEEFVDICNFYLVNKEYIYDASNVTLKILNIKNKKEIDLKNLSSGEKQIISTFSKVYLEHTKDYIILFDEPELSLSIEWQQRFIPDIIQSGNCKQLICVTHSPFIFEEDSLFDLASEILDEIEFIYEEVIECP
ncbi:AAA family ATPase [Lysinibacillus capsici]|uniref:AAA family ATPase n=1 Tax=Lysinibacillus capsici TaxID=2115968 RepID=UPI003D74D974